jgi:hypothetical protein
MVVSDYGITLTAENSIKEPSLGKKPLVSNKLLSIQETKGGNKLKFL